MASEKIIVSATDSGGNSVQRTFDNVNPDATNAQLAALGSKIAALSENTYAKTDRIIRLNCDTEASGGSKADATITLSETTCAKDALGTRKEITYTYNGDGRVFTHVTTSLIGAAAAEGFFAIHVGNSTFLSSVTQDVPITLRAEETANYKAAEAVFTITV